MQGFFLSLEGIDGAGKSSHLEWAAEHLRAQGVRVITTREPGGTPLGERVRDLLLGQSMAADTECLLVFAARAEHLSAVIRPALARGEWVISDRFTDATYAYQCGGRGVPAARIGELENWTQQGLNPNRTWLFDVPVELAQERRAQRGNGNPLDRFEAEAQDFHQRVRAQYRARVQNDPKRFLIVDSSQSLEQIRERLRADLEHLLDDLPGNAKSNQTA